MPSFVRITEEVKHELPGTRATSTGHIPGISACRMHSGECKNGIP